MVEAPGEDENDPDKLCNADHAFNVSEHSGHWVGFVSLVGGGERVIVLFLVLANVIDFNCSDG